MRAAFSCTPGEGARCLIVEDMMCGVVGVDSDYREKGLYRRAPGLYTCQKGESGVGSEKRRGMELNDAVWVIAVEL
jgi:hypothetical protein